MLVVRQQIAQLVKSPFKGCYGRKVKASIVAAIPVFALGACQCSSACMSRCPQHRSGAKTFAEVRSCCDTFGSVASVYLKQDCFCITLSSAT